MSKETIHYKNVRHKSGEALPIESTRTPLNALSAIASADFGWGGVVTNIKKEGGAISITTRTVVLGDVDVTTYTGSEEDMRLILRLSELITLVSGGKAGKVVMESVLAEVEKNPALQKPGILSMAAGFLVGSRRVVPSLLLVLGLEAYGENVEKLHTALTTGGKLDVDDIIAAFELSQNEKVDFAEALYLARPIEVAA